MILRVSVLGSLLILSACSGSGESGQVDRIQSGVLYRSDGTEINTVDPHLSGGAWNAVVNGDMFVGLMRIGPEGDPISGLAESWILSEDGLVWTFTLRDSVWSDGQAITAEDVVYSLRRAIDPATLGAYMDVYAPFVNAEAILNGQASPDSLGVFALDERTVEIHLVHPMPYLPELLADSRSAVVPRHVIEEHGTDWIRPENIVVNGAYTLVERAVDRQTVLRRNPLFFDDTSTCFDEVFNFPSDSAETATRRARTGELDIAAGVPPSLVEQVRAELPGYLHYSRPPGTFYLLGNTQAEPFDDPRVREALGISIDRQFAFEEVIPFGLTVANSLVPPTLTDPYESAEVRWANEPLTSRRQRSLELLQEAGFGPDNPLTFELVYPSGGNADRAMPVLQNDWNSLADWIDVQILGLDPAIHYQNLGAGEFQYAVGGWTASIRDMAYMLDVIKDDAAGNFARWSNPDVERLLVAGQNTQDPAERAAYLREAEQIALDEAALTPLFSQQRGWIIHPQIEGWIGGAVEYVPSALLCPASEFE